jgi:hypothetical protein
MDRGIYVPGHSKIVITKPPSVGIEQQKSIISLSFVLTLGPYSYFVDRIQGIGTFS